MKLAVEGNVPIELTNINLKPGQKVKVTSGPMKGAEGEFQRKARKSKFIINLSQIGFVLQIEVNAADVVKI